MAIDFLSIEDARIARSICKHFQAAARAAEAAQISEITRVSLKDKIQINYTRQFPGQDPAVVSQELRAECAAVIQEMFASEGLRNSGVLTRDLERDLEVEQVLNTLARFDFVQEDMHALRRLSLFYHEFRERLAGCQIRQEDAWAFGNNWETAEITTFQGALVQPGRTFSEDERGRESINVRNAHRNRLRAVSAFLMKFLLQERTAYVYTQHFLQVAQGREDLLPRFLRFQKEAARETRGGDDRVRGFNLEGSHPVYALHNLERISLDPVDTSKLRSLERG